MSLWFLPPPCSTTAPARLFISCNPNNTVTVQPITTLTSNEQVTAVQGVNPGVNLATSGFDRLENGVDGGQSRSRADRNARVRGGAHRQAVVQLHESLPAIHSSSGCNGSADGCALSGGRRGVLPASGFGAARGGLSDHSGTHFLSGGESGCGCLGGDRSAGAAVRPSCRTEPDDIDQRGRRLGHRDAVPAQPEYRCGGAGGAGGDQRGAELSAGQSADAADLQQIQSGRRAGSDARPDLQRDAALAG